jgi:hypothetical protein
MAETYYGPHILHVGERDPKDTKYATDEYVYADPGIGGKVVVAPRLKTEKPSLRNAVKALNRKAPGLIPMEDGGVFQGGDILTQLLQMLTGGASQSFATELPLTQLSIMQALGTIIPGLFGITDPKQFRDMLASGLQSGQGFPTMGMQQQKWQQGMTEQQFGEGRRQFDTSFGEGKRQFDVTSGLEAAEQAYQRSIRGLKGLPAIGNAGSTMPTLGTGTSL